MADLQPFLTVYDPSDLPGGSVDPLGFDRGYSFLADKILPGLTNIARHPRYFSVLCAGIKIADEVESDSFSRPNEHRAYRLHCILKLERFWTLANVLASQEAGEEELDLGGVRGVRYVQSFAGRLNERGAKDTDADFRLLSRQMPYGAVGTYGAVADGMRLVNRDSLSLTPDLGDVLGEAFLNETAVPKVLRRAVQQEKGTVPLSTLVDWGKRAHISGQVGSGEGVCFKDALQQNPIRWRMAQLLVQHPWVENDTELMRLKRIANDLAQGHDDADLREALLAVLSFERCFRLALLGFQRLLWQCREHDPYVVTLGDIAKDEVFTNLGARLRSAYDAFAERLRVSSNPSFCKDLHRLDDVRRFLEQATLSDEPGSLVEALLRRHTEVQRAKLTGGRPKMPWLERAGEQIRPTIGQAMRLEHEPAKIEHITPHTYRVVSAQALLSAAGIV